jgi:hypothetical protein
MNNVDEVTASRLIFALMRVFSAGVAEMPLRRSTNVAAAKRLASIALGRLQIYSGPAISDPKMLGLEVPPRLFAHADGVIE